MRRRRRWLILAMLVLALALLWAGRWRLLALAGSFLVDADPVQRADLIFLLNGDLDTRPAAAAELWRQGLAPLVAIARSESSRAVEMGLVPNVTDLAIVMLEKMGVPRNRIAELPFPGGVTSTRDEAEALRQYLEAHPARSVLIVTNAIHTRRARRIFLKALEGRRVRVAMYSVPDRRYRVDRWWENEHGFLGVYNEYLKLAYYWMRY
ncbi:MAG: YdcF family protein [Bryobacteraceae bacterium]|nr:YdcF family protein [Bryobacteraceae bacterium]MCX7604853.1 YdcF family protein [Bryobacteraceae bacterium]